jgi:hypothetical protein
MTRATLGKAKIAGLMVKKFEIKHLELERLQRTRRMYIPVPSVRQHIEIEQAPMHCHLWCDGLGISRTGHGPAPLPRGERGPRLPTLSNQVACRGLINSSPDAATRTSTDRSEPYRRQANKNPLYRRRASRHVE